jgi:hypothetical protein
MGKMLIPQMMSIEPGVMIDTDKGKPKNSEKKLDPVSLGPPSHGLTGPTR